MFMNCQWYNCETKLSAFSVTFFQAVHYFYQSFFLPELRSIHFFVASGVKKRFNYERFREHMNCIAITCSTGV